MNNSKSIKRIFSKKFNQIRMIPEKIIEKIYPDTPDEFFLTQTKSICGHLPYEEFIKIKDSKNKDIDICILDDGSLCCMWKMNPIEHEIIKVEQFQEGNPKTEFESHVEALKNAFEKNFDSNISYQIIFESEIGGEFEKPHYFNNPQTTAQEVMLKNIESMKNRASDKSSSLKPVKVSIFITMRILPNTGLIQSQKAVFKNKAFLNLSYLF